jgi:hypothetical protein
MRGMSDHRASGSPMMNAAKHAIKNGPLERGAKEAP